MKLYCISGICIIAMILVASSLRPGRQPSLTPNTTTMKLNAGIITTKLKESKEFYQRVLNFGVTFENEFYVLMHTPDKKAELSFLQPNHESQQPIFHSPYGGQGVFLTIEVPNADAEYKRIKELGLEIIVPIRSEPWGDRHFSFYDPNKVAIDIVTYSAPVQEEPKEKKSKDKTSLIPVHL